jgi:hypothetical protein
VAKALRQSELVPLLLCLLWFGICKLIQASLVLLEIALFFELMMVTVTMPFETSRFRGDRRTDAQFKAEKQLMLIINRMLKPITHPLHPQFKRCLTLIHLQSARQLLRNRLLVLPIVGIERS